MHNNIENQNIQQYPRVNIKNQSRLISSSTNTLKLFMSLTTYVTSHSGHLFACLETQRDVSRSHSPPEQPQLTHDMEM